MTPTTPSPISDQAAGELLPCPFCGCSLFPSDLTGEGTRYTIKCQDCPGRMEFFSSDKEQAISAWNRRSTAPATGSAPDIDGIMEQAQVFASAWSLVGGPFDGGDMMETALAEKENLRALLAASIGGDRK
jgi:Lar family restriction alleviation protein